MFAVTVRFASQRGMVRALRWRPKAELAPSALGVAVSVSYGDQDLMVASRHGEWLGHDPPSASIHHLPVGGRVMVLTGHLGELAREMSRALLSS